MAVRYITKPRSFDDDDAFWEAPVLGSSMTVHEDDHGPEPTGILDAHGNELYRVRGRIPFGFVSAGVKKRRRNRA